MTEETRTQLPTISGSALVGKTAFFKEMAAVPTKYGDKTLVKIARSADGEAEKVIFFSPVESRDAVLRDLRAGDEMSFEAVDTGKGNPFVRVSRV